MARKGFTLLELMLVVIIVGIIATFAIPGYFGVKQRAEGRQASTQLRLIHTAEKIKFLENDLFVPCIGFVACNDPINGLDLDLPDDGWTYSVSVAGSTFSATAVATNPVGCKYTMTQASSAITPAGCVYVP